MREENELVILPDSTVAQDGASLRRYSSTLASSVGLNFTSPPHQSPCFCLQISYDGFQIDSRFVWFDPAFCC